MTELKTVMTRTYQDRDVRNVGHNACTRTFERKATVAGTTW